MVPKKLIKPGLILKYQYTHSEGKYYLDKIVATKGSKAILVEVKDSFGTPSESDITWEQDIDWFETSDNYSVYAEIEGFEI